MENKNYLYNNYLNMARNLRMENNLLKALKFYRKAYSLSIGKKDIELLMNMGLIYDEIGLCSEAEQKYKEVLKLDEGEARAYYGLAIIYDENDDLERAKIYYKKAIEKNPNYDKAYFFLANIYDELGDKDKAVEISPKHYKILFNKAVILNKLNKIHNSKAYYRQSIAENAKYPYSFLNLAVIYREKGNFEKAIEVISEGIKENRDQGFLYYNRGCFYLNLAKYSTFYKVEYFAINYNHSIWL